jgi:hypothetical protein
MEPSDNPTALCSPQKRNCIECLKQLIRRHWKPKPIDPPQPDSEIENLTGPQRSAEVIKYSILSLEFWLSPLGRLREWVRLNGKLSAVLLVPALLVVPLITFIVWQIATWFAFLVQIAGSLIVLPLAILAATVLITGVVILTRILLGK